MNMICSVPNLYLRKFILLFICYLYQSELIVTQFALSMTCANIVLRSSGRPIHHRPTFEQLYNNYRYFMLFQEWRLSQLCGGSH